MSSGKNVAVLCSYLLNVSSGDICYCHMEMAVTVHGHQHPHMTRLDLARHGTRYVSPAQTSCADHCARCTYPGCNSRCSPASPLCLTTSWFHCHSPLFSPAETSHHVFLGVQSTRLELVADPTTGATLAPNHRLWSIRS